MTPRSPVRVGEKRQNDRIRKSNKISEITVEDKSHNAALDRVRI